MNPDGTRDGYAITSSDPVPVDLPTKPKVFHVWVQLSHLSKMAQREYPGLLLGWRKTGSGWEAQVIWIIPGAGSDSAHVDWVSAHQLRPA
ncbi:hypothetical protein BH09ACT10_BH09ACT10_26180 [soil metagenome]